MTDNLILYELQKIHETKSKEVHTLNLRMVKLTEILTLMNLYLIQQN